MKILDLPLKKKWFEMIESGKKREEYRELKDYWRKRLIEQDELRLKPYTHVRFRYGYTRRTMLFRIDSISIGVGNPDWGAPSYPVFIIKFHKQNYMKSYTDLKQSKVLAEILSHDTADQTWQRIAIAGANLGVPEEGQYRHNGNMPFQIYSGIGIPCWSLAALLDYLCIIDMFPTIENDDNQFKLILSIVEENKEHLISDVKTIIIKNKELVDACVELIIKLHELKLL